MQITMRRKSQPLSLLSHQANYAQIIETSLNQFSILQNSTSHSSHLQVYQLIQILGYFKGRQEKRIT